MGNKYILVIVYLKHIQFICIIAQISPVSLAKINFFKLLKISVKK